MTAPGSIAVTAQRSPLHSELSAVVKTPRQRARPPDAVCFEIAVTWPGKFGKHIPCDSPEDIWFDDGMRDQLLHSAVKAVKIVAFVTKRPVELSIHGLNHAGRDCINSVAFISQRESHGIEGARHILPL